MNEKSRKRWKKEAPRVAYGAHVMRWSDVTIEDITYFGKRLDVIENRCKVVNQMLGYTRVGARTNPMRLSLDHGQYLVKLGSALIVSFGVYDIDGIENAIVKLDGMSDGIWCALGEGLLRVA